MEVNPQDTTRSILSKYSRILVHMATGNRKFVASPAYYQMYLNFQHVKPA